LLLNTAKRDNTHPTPCPTKLKEKRNAKKEKEKLNWFLAIFFETFNSFFLNVKDNKNQRYQQNNKS
jgi:hypothetical protein